MKPLLSTSLMGLTALVTLAVPAFADWQMQQNSDFTKTPAVAVSNMERAVQRSAIPDAGSGVQMRMRELMDAGNAARVAREGAAAARFDLDSAGVDGFDNPLARDDAPGATDHRHGAIGERWERLRGVQDMPGGLDMIDRLGLPSNDTSRATPPGVRVDADRINPGNIAGTRVGHPNSIIDSVSDDEPWMTKERQGDEWVMTEREQDGSVRRTHEHVTENGDLITRIYHYDEHHNPTFYTWSVYTARGAVQFGTTDIQAGTQSWFTRGANGRPADEYDGPISRVPRGGFDRTMSGEETSGAGWCPPSGYGCASPLTAGELRAGGRRERPDPDAGETRAPVRVPLARDALVINPDPHRERGSGAPSARDLDGGRLVNPVGTF